jgi:hypothetical protein
VAPPTSVAPPTTVAPTTTTTSTTTDLDGPAGPLSSPAVAAYLSARTGSVTAALYNVDTGTTSLWQPGVAEDTASIVKVDILATLLHQNQDADGDADDGVGLSSSQRALATTMIEQSDNDAATDLWNDDGQETGIGAFNKLIPLSATVLGTDGYWGLTKTTAADQVKLVRTVALPNQILDTTARTYELGLMESVESGERWGVSGGVPEGVTVALKNGWLPIGANDWQINSIGWIQGDGRDYILAVLSDGNPTEGYGIDTIQGLSAQVWAALAPG